MKITHRPVFAFSLIAIGLLCIAAKCLYLFQSGLALRLPGEIAPLITMALALPVFLTPFAICLYSLILAVLAACRKSRAMIIHLTTCVLLGITIWLAGKLPTSLFDVGIIQKLRTSDETAYLELAAYIRNRVPPEFDSFQLQLDGSQASMDYEAKQRENTERLNALMPDNLAAASMWPKEMLKISVDPNMVKVYRGSGMLGLIGVVILEKGSELEEFPKEQLASNPYLPRYIPIYDRVYFFYSD